MEHHEAPKFIRYRHHVRPGKIMKSSTFHEIEESAKRRYHLSPERAKKVAGHAYWMTLESKYKKRHH